MVVGTGVDPVTSHFSGAMRTHQDESVYLGESANRLVDDEKSESARDAQCQLVPPVFGCLWHGSGTDGLDPWRPPSAQVRNCLPVTSIWTLHRGGALVADPVADEPGRVPRWTPNATDESGWTSACRWRRWQRHSRSRGHPPGPAERGKPGRRWSMLTERCVISIGWAADGANRHVVILVAPTLDPVAAGGLLHKDVVVRHVKLPFPTADQW